MRSVVCFGFLFSSLVVVGTNGECRYIQICPPPPTDISADTYCQESTEFFECAEPIIEKCSDEDMPQLKREAFYASKASQQERCHKKNEEHCKKAVCVEAPWPTGDPTGCPVQLKYLDCVRPYVEYCPKASAEEVYEYRYRLKRVGVYCKDEEATTITVDVGICRKPVCEQAPWPTGREAECPQQLKYLRCVGPYMEKCDQASSEEVYEYRYRQRRVALYCREEETTERAPEPLVQSSTTQMPKTTTPLDCDNGSPSCGTAPWTYRGPGDCSDLVLYMECMTPYSEKCEETYTFRFAKRITDRDCEGVFAKSTAVPGGETTLPPACDKSSCGTIAWVIGTEEDCIDQKEYIVCVEPYILYCPTVSSQETYRYNYRIRVLNLYCKDNTTTTTLPPSPEPKTQKPTTPAPTTQKPTTSKPATPKPTTAKPTTAAPTPNPSTEKPTPKPTTKKPTPEPTTEKPTTEKPTPKPTTEKPTPQPTTEKPTPKPTTEKPTPEPTTRKPTNKPITTKNPVTPEPNPKYDYGSGEVVYCVVNCEAPATPLTTKDACGFHQLHVECIENSYVNCDVTEQEEQELKILRQTVDAFCATPSGCPDDFEDRLVKCQSQIGLGVISAVRLAGLESTAGAPQLDISFDDLTSRCYPRSDVRFEDALQCTEDVLSSCSDKKSIRYLKKFVDIERQRRAIKTFCDYREVMRKQLSCMEEKGAAIIPSYKSIVRRLHSEITEIRSRNRNNLKAMTATVCRYSEEAAFFTNSYFKDCGGNLDLIVKEILHADVPDACKIQETAVTAANRPSAFLTTIIVIIGSILLIV